MSEVYVRCFKGDVARTESIGTSNLIIDYHSDGRPIGVEILDAYSLKIDGVPVTQQTQTVARAIAFLQQFIAHSESVGTVEPPFGWYREVKDFFASDDNRPSQQVETDGT